MKHKINLLLLSAVLLGSVPVMAQEGKVAAECSSCGTKPSPQISLTHYALDNRLHYSVGDCVPNSDVELYSTSSGGEVVAYAQADAKGRVDFSVKEGTPVAFALNHDRINEKGVTGKGQILVIPALSMNLKSPEVSIVNNEAVVRWYAAALDKQWNFVLQKSTDNIHYSPVYETAAAEGKAMQPYTYSDKTTEAVQGGTCYYRVVATNASGDNIVSGERAVKIATAKNFFTASPTVFSNSIQVSVPADKLPATYTLTDALGRTRYASGIISRPSQLIALNLVSGSYRLVVVDKNNSSGAQWLIRQ